MSSKFKSDLGRTIGAHHDKHRKFYKAINNAKKSFLARICICKKKDGCLVCDKNRVLDRWKEHYSELLNKGAV